MSAFEIRAPSGPVAVSTTVERVVAFLAVRQRPQLRSTVAATLWMDTTDDRAFANLRTALWRARQVIDEVVQLNGNYLSLSPQVDVDLDELIARARRLIAADGDLESGDGDPATLVDDLLPGWDEEWIVFERERLRQLRIHALESLCSKLSDAGRPGEAIDAGLAAVLTEPLRESAQRVLVEAHLAEGNVSEARRQYQQYRELLWDALGLEPSEEFRSLVGLGSKLR